MKMKKLQIDSNIDSVLNDLSSLKTSLNTDNIQSKLFTLNTSFTVLINTLKKKMPSEVKFELSYDDNRYLNDIKLYKYLDCSIMTINDRILKVETGNKQLDILCMKKKRIEEVEELIYMFYESACDKCGLYFCKIDMEMAVVRQKEKDYISVYHKQC